MKKKHQAIPVGTRFGTRVTTGPGRRQRDSVGAQRWVYPVRCDCGVEYDVFSSTLTTKGVNIGAGCPRCSARRRELRAPAVGEMFGYWTVTGETVKELNTGGQAVRMTPVECKCGYRSRVRLHLLHKGGTTGCMRCRAGAWSHGDSKTKLYKAWSGMRARCDNPNTSNYHHYGGRGIRYVPEWSTYEPFRDWALMAGYADGLSLDRIKVNGNYEPDNCRWVPWKKQGNNKRNNRLYTAFGETKTASEWADDPRARATEAAIRLRVLRRGWEPERAITEPLSNRGGSKPKETT